MLRICVLFWWLSQLRLLLWFEVRSYYYPMLHTSECTILYQVSFIKIFHDFEVNLLRSWALADFCINVKRNAWLEKLFFKARIRRLEIKTSKIWPFITTILREHNTIFYAKKVGKLSCQLSIVMPLVMNCIFSKKLPCCTITLLST